MIVYIIPTILCLIFIYNYDYKEQKGLKYACFNLLMVYLILLAGLSYRIGGDSGFYMESYTQIPTISHISIKSITSSYYQPFYYLLCVICKSITDKIWLMHMAQSAIVCFVFFSFIRRNTKYIFTAAFLFMTCVYTYFCYEIYKESLAVSMTLAGYRYLIDKKYVKYSIFAICALMFHFSGIIAFIIPFIRFLKFNFKLLVPFIIFIIILSGFHIYISYFIQNQVLFEKLEYYTYLVQNRYNQNWFIMAMLRNVVVPTGIALWIKWKYKILPYEWAFVTYVFFGIGSLELALIFDRPINYMLPYVVIALAIIMGSTYKGRFLRVLTMFMICFIFWFSCRGWFYLRKETWRLMIPYESIFNETKDFEREKVIKMIH